MIFLNKIKKTLSLIIISLYLISCTAKVNIIEDSFYNTKYYQTDFVTITSWTDTLKLRLKNISGTDNIILEAQYTSDDSFTVTEKNKIILKFDDNTFLSLYYTSLFPKTDINVIYGTSIYFMDTSYVDRSYTIYAEGRINELKKLIEIRVETTDGFKNIKVKEKGFKELEKLYLEMKDLISK